jgi:hypothetical protein
LTKVRSGGTSMTVAGCFGTVAAGGSGAKPPLTPAAGSRPAYGSGAPFGSATGIGRWISMFSRASEASTPIRPMMARLATLHQAIHDRFHDEPPLPRLPSRSSRARMLSSLEAGRRPADMKGGRVELV